VTGPVILDPVAVALRLLPPRVTSYQVVPRWLDCPGTPHRDYRPVDPDLGARLIGALQALGPREAA